MSEAVINGCRHHYQVTGVGEPVLLAHGLLFNGDQWDGVLAHLTGYRAVTFDWRGQHRSEVTEDGYDNWSLGRDALALMDHLGIERAHWVGLSMGGFVGLRLALAHPERLLSLTLIDSAAVADLPEQDAMNSAFVHVARRGELDAVAPGLPPIFFSPTFIAEHGAVVQGWVDRIMAADTEGLCRATLGAVVGRDDVSDRLTSIGVPTLVMCGTEDVPQPLERSEAMASAIPGARLVRLEGLGHMSAVEDPDLVGRELRAFLAGVHATATA
ncbi:MAG: alpha/beta fold hydrolase [Candidatus Dormibacteria bacterium]